MSYVYQDQPTSVLQSRELVTTAYRVDETACVNQLLSEVESLMPLKAAIHDRASALVQQMRHIEANKSGVDRLMTEYDLSSEEGIALMCLAESLLRIPDAETMDEFIKDKLTKADWRAHLDKGNPLFVNAATWGLMLTGKIYQGESNSTSKWGAVLNKLVKRSGEGVIRPAIKQAMRVMGKQFVMGETIHEAIKRAASEGQPKNYTYSYDMLGEAAKTEADALKYYQAYEEAIRALAADAKGIFEGAGISVKLSALHPRYEESKRQLILEKLLPRVRVLAVIAKEAGIGLTIDAEEADRLEISLDILESLFACPDLQGWQGLGLAVQAYQKRAMPLLAWLKAQAEKNNRQIMVRLVKGAYWDAEIKRSQELGLAGFPVFTRKQATDVSYLACAQYLLAHKAAFYPQFATHNAYTLAAVIEMAPTGAEYEFQRLHGMGESLYDDLVAQKAVRCRVYAPVGGHKHLLAYLVRRLLENGANTSFVNRIADANAPIDELVACPISKLVDKNLKPHPGIALPAELFSPERRNALSVDLSDRGAQGRLKEALLEKLTLPRQVVPLLAQSCDGEREKVAVTNPTRREQQLGTVEHALEADIEQALAGAIQAQPAWDALGVEARAAIIERAGDLLEQQMPLFMGLLVREAGKTLPNALAEVREAIDFCRYYAVHARQNWAEAELLPGPTGERNTLSVHGRGVMVCISPWNFPLAIFLGQVVAALVTGNAVLAKPADQTPLVAYEGVRLLLQAGVPAEVLAYLPGTGSAVGAKLVQEEAIAGVLFTGSFATAKRIERALAARQGPIVPLIAETGGQNAMIVDSTALLEQVVTDVVMSAFDSAGQRCSALRVLLVHDSIADELIEMLVGAMKELSLGDPAWLATDVGPVIDEVAKKKLDSHIARMRVEAKIHYQLPMPAELQEETFVAPTLLELEDWQALGEEMFGPILHVMRFKSAELEQQVQAINALGFGLTFGLHSRIEDRISVVEQTALAGNLYINRNTVGAVVGVQPFGGQGFSGTGPKAGGPHYLARLVTERTVSVNTTAFGGNASLLSLDDDVDSML